MRWIGLTLFGLLFGLVIGLPLLVLTQIVGGQISADWLLRAIFGWPVLLIVTSALGNAVLGRARPHYGRVLMLERAWSHHTPKRKMR